MRNFPDVHILLDDAADQRRLSEAVYTQNRRSKGFAQFVGDLGERKTIEALRVLGVTHEIVVARKGQRGFDLTIKGRDGRRNTLVQVKTSTFLDEVQGIFKNLAFDLAIIVDIGVAIVDRPVTYSASLEYPYQPFIDFYLLTRDDVRTNAIVNKAGAFIYGLKDLRRSSLSKMQHFRGLPDHKNRWDLLLEAI